MTTPWPTKPLSEVCELFADGDWIESKDQSLSGIRLIQTGNIGSGEFKNRDEKARYISEDTFKRLRCTEVFAGDCLISRLPEPVGRSCLLPSSNERMITAVDCTIARFSDGAVLPEFFNYYSQAGSYVDAVDAMTTGTTRKRISRSRLGRVPVPVAPLPEQQRVVGILDEALGHLASARENTEKDLRNARAVLEGARDAVFTEARDRWPARSLGEVARFRNGVSFTKSSRGESVRIIGVKDFQDRFEAPYDGLDAVEVDGMLAEVDALMAGDVLFVRSNGNVELIGRTLLVGEIREKTTHSGFTIRARLVESGLSPRFLCHFLKSSRTRRQMVSGGAGTNIKSLSQGTLSALDVPIAPSEEQHHIIQTLERLGDEVRRLDWLYRRRLTALSELKQSLLQQAFAGKL